MKSFHLPNRPRKSVGWNLVFERSQNWFVLFVMGNDWRCFTNFGDFRIQVSLILYQSLEWSKKSRYSALKWISNRTTVNPLEFMGTLFSFKISFVKISRSQSGKYRPLYFVKRLTVNPWLTWTCVSGSLH